jgi:spore coat protein CotF
MSPHEERKVPVLGDRLVALGLRQELSALAGVYLKAVTETRTPELRRLLVANLEDLLQGHEKLAHILDAEDWYPQHEDPGDQLRAVYDWLHG